MSTGDVPGNVLAGHAAFQRTAMRVVVVLEQMEAALYEVQEGSVVFEAVRFKTPSHQGGDWLAVVSGRQNGAPVVAFHSATTFVEVVRGFCERFMNKSLKWRPDEFRQ